MKEQAEKLRSAEKALSESKGHFDLFGLFLRKDAPDKWDLLISADWAREDKKAAIKCILEEIRKVLSDQELLMLSRLVVLDQDDMALKALRGATHVEHGLAEISNYNFLGLEIKHAYLITSMREVHPNLHES